MTADRCAFCRLPAEGTVVLTSGDYRVCSTHMGMTFKELLEILKKRKEPK